MPIYDLTGDNLKKTLKYQTCAVCGERLAEFFDAIEHRHFVACSDWTRTHHEGIAKEYTEKNYNIAARRSFMTQEIGEQKTQALAKYSGCTSLTKEEATQIIDTIWPAASKASPAEVYKAVSICAQYGLNPLMKHLYLIPFNKREKRGNEWVSVGTTYAAVLGISANRLIATRKHAYSYIDESPRLMSEAEQVKVYGKVDPENIVAVTILKDTRTGASARGYGKWPRAKAVQGEDKGNTPENMAMIRSERQALDRLYPAELPDAPVVDDQYVPPSVSATVEETAAIEPPKSTADEDFEKLGHEQPAEASAAPAATGTKEEPKPAPGYGRCKHGDFELTKGCAKCTQEKAAPEKVEGIDMDWLAEAMKTLAKWKVGTWLHEHYPQAEGHSVRDIVKSLTVDQRKEFAKEVQDRLSML
jgi:hypothetical protein